MVASALSDVTKAIETAYQYLIKFFCIKQTKGGLSIGYKKRKKNGDQPAKNENSYILEFLCLITCPERPI